MKNLSREINKFLMDLDDCNNSRSEFSVINKLEEFITETKYSMSHNKRGESYYELACNEMFNDIGRYLENFRKNNDLPGKQYYSIRITPRSAKTIKLSFNLKANNMIKITALRNSINSFPKYTIFFILGLDSVLENEYIKFNRYLIKDEYDKFLMIRENDPEYFLPFIQHILYEMKNMKFIKEE